PTLTFMRRQSKESALAAWKETWRKNRRDENEGNRQRDFSVANTFEPSLKPPPHFRRILNRRIYGLVFQCRTGHAFIGEYYQRFVPTEDVACPCGFPLQTRKHILLDCPRYNAHRHILNAISPRHSSTLKDIVGTSDGIKALAKFIAASGAFTK
ncbi:hypothetical protein K474DRAFT_1573738, partial [Panus rudis PR-1116 ss-1]